MSKAMTEQRLKQIETWISEHRLRENKDLASALVIEIVDEVRRLRLFHPIEPIVNKYSVMTLNRKETT